VKIELANIAATIKRVFLGKVEDHCLPKDEG